MFDFSKYFKKMSGKTDAKIELKDVPIKSDSSVSSDDGVSTLNEYVTKNIDYIVTDITLGDYGLYYGTDKYFDGSDDDKSSKIVQKCSIIDEDGNEGVDRYAFRIGSSLGDAEYDAPRPGGTLITSVSGYAHYDDDANVDEKIPLTLTVVPKYRLIGNPQPVATDADIYAHALAMFGLLGAGCETYKWAKSSKHKTKNCVMSNSTLQRRMEDVSAAVSKNRYEVEVSTYYDLADPNAPEPVQGQAKVDISAVELPRTMTAATIVSSGNTADFCSRMQNYGYMIDCDGDNRTPFLPSLRDAFEAYFPKEDVADSFNESFDDVLAGIKSLWVLKKALKSSTRKKIAALSGNDFRNATVEELNYTADGETFLVDIESLKCKHAKNDGWDANLTLVTPYYANGKYKRFRFSSVDASSGKYVYKAMANPLPKNGLSDAYSDANCENAMISYTEYSIGDFYSLLVQTYDTYCANRSTGSRARNIANLLNHAMVGTSVPVANSANSSFSWTPYIGAVQSQNGIDDDKTFAAMEDWLNANSEKTVKVVDWYKGVETDSDGSLKDTEINQIIPLFQADDSIQSTNLHKKMDIVDDVDDIVDKFDTAIAAIAFVQPSLAAILKRRLSDLNRAVSEFNNAIGKIKYFEYYTADSVFDSKERILGDGDCYRVTNGIPETARYPARFLVPTRIYKKVKQRKRVLCFWRTVTRTKCVGTRWTEIRFVNVGLYDKYPKDMRIPERMVPFESGYTYATDIVVDKEIPSGIEAGRKVALKVENLNDEIPATIKDAHTISIDQPADIPKKGTTQYFMVSLDDTKSGIETSQVHVEYNIPYFPYDDEIRAYAFGTYGPFDQSKYAIKDRSGNFGSGKDGWRIFNDTSNELSAMRKGINIYPSVANLLKILKDAFGKNRAELVETTRSAEDQMTRCMGGTESAFLSWHNYGLAVKIMVYQDDLKTPIEDESEDMLKLAELARQFSDDCINGKFGARFNVVWCGRLTVGADLFDWEFLPVGVNHKDAPKFREILLAQRDPIIELGYVPADAFAKPPSDELQHNKSVQWISTTSSVYRNAETFGGVKYVSPASIRNFKFPKKLPLINLIEFIRLIQVKMDAYGTKMPNKGDMYEWINKNRSAYEQLLTYFGMTGNLQSFRSLLAGEYITRYKPIVTNYYSTDPIAFVQYFLGDEYNKVKIRADDMVDASYITLSDGRLHIPRCDGRPRLPLSVDNMYDQKQVTKDNYQRGRWIDGRFIPSATDDEYVSSSSVIGGYNNFEPVGGDAYILHAFIGDQIKQEFDSIVSMFEGYNGDLMFDSFQNGPYADKYEQLENEFGIIAKQDLIDFDKLKGMIVAADLDITTDKETGRKDIYEKVVSNAECAGMRLASLGSEHVEVNPKKSETVTIEDVYRIIGTDGGPSANDLMKSMRRGN